MSEYDGSIRIQTKIETKNLEQNLTTLENKVIKSAQKVDTLQKKLDELGSTKIPTDEFAEVDKQLQKAKGDLAKLQERMEKFLELGGDKKSKTFTSMQYDMAELENTIEYAQGEMQDLIDTNQAFIEPTGTDAYKKLATDLEVANSELDMNKIKLIQVRSQMAKSQSATHKFGQAMKNVGEEGGKAFDKLKKSIKKVLLLVIGVRTLRAGFMKLRTAIVDTIPDLRSADSEFDATMTSWENASNSIKGSLTSAFGEIAIAVMPVLLRITDAVQKCTDAIAQLFTYLRGETVWKKVKSGATSAAKAIDSTSKSAKGALASFDELNVLSKSDSSSSDSSSSGVEYEDVPVDVSAVESIKEKFEELLPLIIGCVGALTMLSLGLNLGWAASLIAGLMLVFLGLGVAISGCVSAWNNGLDFSNMATIIAGAALVVLGLGIAFGTIGAVIGTVVAGIAMVVVGLHDMITNGVNFQNTFMVILGTVIALFAVFGAGVAAIGAIVAAVVIAIIADWDNFKKYISNMWAQIKVAFQTAFNAIFGRFSEFGKKFAEAWNKLWNGDVLEAFGLFGESLKALIAGIINGAIFLVNGAIAIFSMLITAIDGAINAVINAINSINVKIPDWVPVFGGKEFSPNIPNIPELTLPQIPYLATGTVVPANYGEFAAILGDNKKEPEVVSPLSTMKSAMVDALSEVGLGSNEIVINADADMAALIKLLNLKLTEENNRIGRNMNKVVHVNG